jgi:hypothetical protein
LITAAGNTFSSRFGLFIRTIGIARGEAELTLANLA